MKGRIYNINNTKEIMRENNILMKKSLGQNFLIDGNILRKIVDSANLNSDDNVLEVGPGIGSLSEEILIRGNNLTSIEIDKKFQDILKNNLGKFKNFKLVEGDALSDENWELANKEPIPNVFIANLPYVITTPILEKIFKSKNKFKSIVVMVQKEVADRMTAKEGTKIYGSLSVFVSFFGRAEELFIVSENSFIPKPKVKSAVVRINTIDRDEDATEFMNFVHKAFNLRRKTLLNSLENGYDLEKEKIKTKILNVGIDPSIRAEKLSLEDFLKLYKEFK